MNPNESNSGGATLQQAVRLTLGARRIAALADEVDMVALNSAFAARRAGTAGFAVVSRELRAFGAELAQTMDALTAAAGRLVASAAQLLDNARRDRLLARTASLSGNRLDAALRRKAAAAENAGHLVGRRRAEIEVLAGRAARLCDIGAHLARNGRIEACGAGAMAAQLDAIAATVAATVGGIRAELDAWKDCEASL